MTQAELSSLFAYAVDIRQKLHAYPEVGFDLPHTTALVAAELHAMGIVPTDKYGVCSLVGEIGRGEKLIALRADMDALPVNEEVDLPFRSQIPGQMHACGHDAHTAILLAAARYLKAHEAELPCRVRLIFQPSEEGQQSGAQMMVENGVMDGVDHIICTHCDHALDSGFIGVRTGDYMAACVPATVRFIGHSAHATLPEDGADAIAMAAEAYARMKEMIVREAGGTPYIWSVGRFAGGTVHNVIADKCEMDISFRFYDMALEERVRRQVFAICEAAAAHFGGRVEFDWHISTGPVINNAAVTEAFTARCAAEGLPTRQVERRMSSEDFGWYLTKAPGMLFRFGTKNESKGCTGAVHCSDFKLDEDAMPLAIRAFCSYILSRK